MQETKEMQVQPLEWDDSPGEDNPLQYFCLGNTMDRGAFRATVHRTLRIRHDRATKQQQQQSQILSFLLITVWWFRIQTTWVQIILTQLTVRSEIFLGKFLGLPGLCFLIVVVQSLSGV